MKAFITTMAETVAKVNGKVVGIADMSQATVFNPAEGNMLAEIMQKDNPRVERTAFLVSESAILGMQIGRLIRKADLAHRRAFRDSEELLEWLAECLGDEEVARARAFLDEK